MPETRTPTDTDLLLMHTDGDSDAFGVLYQRHHDKLLSVAARIAGPHDAEDALQDGMIKAYRQAWQFRRQSAVSTWLYRIVSNAAYDLVRRRQPVVDVSTAAEPSYEPTGILATLRRIDIQRYWPRLSPEQRQAIMLVDIMDHTVATAARIAGVPEGTIKIRAARGRAILRPLLPRQRLDG